MKPSDQSGSDDCRSFRLHELGSPEEIVAYFNELTAQIMAQGYDQETASNFAVLIGDIPIMDEAGNLVVMDGEEKLAVLKPLQMFKEI